VGIILVLALLFVFFALKQVRNVVPWLRHLLSLMDKRQRFNVL
jgi:predicted PurR-regulated permease PerM